MAQGSPVAVASSSEVSVSGADAIEDLLSAAYPLGFTIEQMRQKAKASFRRHDAGTFMVDEVVVPGRLRSATNATGGLLVGRVRAGRIHVTCDGIEDRVAAGGTYIPGHPDSPTRGRSDRTRVQAVTLTPTVLTAAAGLISEEAPSLRFARLTTASAADDALWAAAADHAASIPIHRHTQLVVDAAARMLAITALTVFPNNFTAPDPLLAPPGHVGEPTLAKAVAFIEENVHRPVSLGDMAAAAGGTGRALQYAFRSTYDTTPLAFLRRLRLERAHEQLALADPADGTTVGVVAALWGWSNQGRFTTAYRHAFGVSPSSTLNS
ncbi:AraC family transcriptional regulator [Streptomyces sp. NPDC047023]|uniref:helix-turn-helix domain-containing protein n=1 Tax=Streptomyces sp. NPDC047023 TaxID=3155139 RepID=UPI0033DC7DFD